jgi:hypothetical protein
VLPGFTVRVEAGGPAALPAGPVPAREVDDLNSRRIILVAGLGALALVLASCRLTVSPGVSVSTSLSIGTGSSGLIRSFTPTRGTGSTYFIGQDIQFRINLGGSGYLTVVVRDPSGIVSQIYPAPGFFDPPRLGPGTYTLPLPSSGYRYTVGPPTGYHEVRAILTPEWPGASSRVSFRGYFSSDGFANSLSVYISPYPRSRTDIATTYFFAR